MGRRVDFARGRHARGYRRITDGIIVDCRSRRRHTGACRTGGRSIWSFLHGVTQAIEETVRRHLGHVTLAIFAILKMSVDRLGRGIVELAQAIGALGCLGSDDCGLGASTGAISRFGSTPTSFRQSLSKKGRGQVRHAAKMKKFQ